MIAVVTHYPRRNARRGVAGAVTHETARRRVSTATSTSCEGSPDYTHSREAKEQRRGICTRGLADVIVAEAAAGGRVKSESRIAMIAAQERGALQRRTQRARRKHGLSCGSQPTLVLLRARRSMAAIAR